MTERQTNNDSNLLITRHGGNDWSVWITLPNHDALNDAVGFVIGSGETRDAAVASAVADLESALRRLQSPQGEVEERAI